MKNMKQIHITILTQMIGKVDNPTSVSNSAFLVANTNKNESLNFCVTKFLPGDKYLQGTKCAEGCVSFAVCVDSEGLKKTVEFFKICGVDLGTLGSTGLQQLDGSMLRKNSYKKR